MLVVPLRGGRRAGGAAARGAAGRGAGRTCSRSCRGTRPTTRSRSSSGAGSASAANVAIGDQTWARFVLDLQRAAAERPVPEGERGHGAAPHREGRGRGRRAAGRRARGRRHRRRDARAARSPGAPRRDVHRELVERILDAGHERANFAIVASGPNGASPHHEPGGRVIEPGDVVLCDFGGTMRPLLLRHHADVRRGRARARGRRRLRGARRRAGARRAGGDRRRDVRRRRRGGARRHHRRRLRRPVHPPHRSRHRRRGPRGPVRGRGQRPAAAAGPRVQHRAGRSTSPAASGCGSRTSWWRPPPARSG